MICVSGDWATDIVINPRTNVVNKFSFIYVQSRYSYTTRERGLISSAVPAGLIVPRCSRGVRYDVIRYTIIRYNLYISSLP